MNRDTDPNLFIQILKNFGRNIRATAGHFILGVALSALFQRYVPSEIIEGLFGKERGMGILMEATAFMITKPATRITNLGAVKIVLGMKQFVLYLMFVILFSLITGLAANIVTVLYF